MTKRLLVTLPIIALIAVGFYFILTTSPSIRYWVDDFCSAILLRNNGYFAAQVAWWNSWTGRYSYIAALDFFELLGPWVVRILPLILLALLLLSLKSFHRISKILPVLFVFLTLVNAPNIIQTFYWQTGSLNYIAPFIFLNIFLGLVVFPPKKLNIFLPGIILFIAGGFSEAYALPQIVLLAFIIIALKVIKFPENDRRIKIAVSGLAGGILSIGLMALSPGNAARALTVTQPSSIWFVIKSTLYGTKWYLFRMLSIKPFLYSLILLFTSILVLIKPIKLKVRDAVILGALSLMVAIFSTMAVIGSGFYSMSILPPERTLFIAIYFILVCFAGFAFSVKPFVTKSWLVWGFVVLNVISSFLLIKSVVLNWNSVRSEIRSYAIAFDKIEPTLIANSGKLELSIQNIKPVGELDSFTDNKGWVASCVAGYYQVKSIKIEE